MSKTKKIVDTKNLIIERALRKRKANFIFRYGDHYQYTEDGVSKYDDHVDNVDTDSEGLSMGHSDYHTKGRSNERPPKSRSDHYCDN